MKVPIDQYDSKLHARVFIVFVAAMLVATAIAWSIDTVYGQGWHGQLIAYFDSFWSKPASEARLIASIDKVPHLVGPYLLAQATFTIFMIAVVVWFVVGMRKSADFSNPGKLTLQSDSLFLAPVALGLAFAIVYLYTGFDETTSISRWIFGTHNLLLWVPVCYAGASIICIRIAAVFFARRARKAPTL
ncbi:MAG: hypothetical protein K8F25_05505 [Fimbriimonadaceae bacterium]|nr:hypothetical protein [Alphaproteobacteria bacterium]